MTESTHLSTWVCADAKERFAAAAVRQGLSESALLRRLIEQMLASSGLETKALELPPDNRDARVTIRLVAEDRALLRERAAARTVPAATYVSFLVRSHLRGVAPLPERELSALRAAITEMSALGRNLQVMAQLLQRGDHPNPPDQKNVLRMMQIGEVLMERFRALIKANLVSWTTGRAQ
jgi:predicted DNA binding CopG/RHH family protein